MGGDSGLLFLLLLLLVMMLLLFGQPEVGLGEDVLVVEWQGVAEVLQAGLARPPGLPPVSPRVVFLAQQTPQIKKANNCIYKIENSIEIEIK